MMQNIPDKFVEFVKRNPEVSGTSLFNKGLAPSPRTARRWKSSVLESSGRTIKYKNFREIESPEEIYTFEELLDRADEHARYFNTLDPILTHEEITFQTDKPVGILFPSCAHLGGRYTYYKQVRALMDQVLDTPNLFWGPLGDDIEGFRPDFFDKRASMEMIYTIPEQWQLLTGMLDRLASKQKLLWGVASQHGGDWDSRKTGTNPVKRIYLEHDVPFFDGQAYVKLNVGSQTYQIAMAHEFPGSSIYNKMHPHTRALLFNFPMADVIVQGDKHTYGFAEDTHYVWEVEAGNRPSPFVWKVQVGTAKTGPDPYTIKNWSVGVFEWPILVFDPKNHQVYVTRNINHARNWLLNGL